MSQKEIDAIKEAFDTTFSKGEVILFGSRVDDTKKGGDIDLFLKVPKDEISQFKRVEFVVKAREKIFQKIDVVFAKDASRAIEKIASKGIRLHLKE